MGKNKQQVPRLRFPGFNDAWEQRKLGECGNTFTGLSGKSKFDFGHGSARYITYVNVLNNPIADKNAVGLVEIDDKQNQVKYGDCFFTTSSETPEEVGMSSVWLENTSNFYLNSFCFGYRPTTSFNPYYLAFMLRSDGFRKKVTFLAQGISRFNISKTKVMDLEIFIPSLKEQTTIGNFFRQLDAAIASHQRKLERTNKLKKSLLQKMFPKDGEAFPELRFPDFTDAWEQRKLGEVAERVTRKNTEMISKLPLTISAQYGLIAQTEFFDKQIASKNISGYYLIKNGEFAYNKSYSNGYPWGAVKRLNNYDYGVLSTLYIVFKPTNINSQFLVSYYDTNYWHNQVASIAVEGARNHGLLNISASEFFTTTLAIPKSIQEQTAIGDFFRQLDAAIASHQRKLEHMQTLKKGLLQQMFV